MASILDEFDDLMRVFDGGRNLFSCANSSVLPHNLYLDKDENFCAEIALAGYRKEDISITTNDVGFQIEVAGVPKKDVKSIHLGIRGSGMTFKLYLPTNNFNSNSAKVTFENGILKICVPPLEDKKSRKINIE